MRRRLVVAIAALAAVALLVANGAGILLLRGYLTQRVDHQLRGMSRPLASVEPFSSRLSRPRPGPRTGFAPDQLLVLYDAAGGQVVSDVSSVQSPPDLTFADLAAHAGHGPFTVDARDGDGRWRVDAVSRVDGGLAVVGVSLNDVDATANRLLVIDASMTALVLLALVLVAAWVVRLGMRPLTRMEDISAEITAGNLSRRVPDTDPHTEPGRLGLALNTMLDRIEAEIAARIASERQVRQFVADASHELRTPLTSIRGFAELYRRGGAPAGPALDETMARIEDEAARMGLLVDDLLLLARLDRQRPLERRPVDLLALAADTIRDAHARMPGRTVRLSGLDETSDTFEPVTVLGDEHRLRQVAINLISNALQHTSASAQVTVKVGRCAGQVPDPAPTAVVGTLAGEGPFAVLEVSDTGPGVPPEHAPRVFERLYRVDPSRARSHGGSGLGLSIVAAIVQSHGGRVELVSSDQGATFRVLLPIRSG